MISSLRLCLLDRVYVGIQNTYHPKWRFKTRRWDLVRHFSSTARAQLSFYPLVIVGGGPVGLFLASLLKRYGVDFCLLEAKPLEEHFHHPQAHFLNTRTMEILKHHVPSIFHQVVQAMPPVQEWNKFHFGANMTSSPIAIVQHPVHVPLVANSNANGVLLETHTSNHQFHADSTEAVPLSDCPVGHLAQHTFHRILYDQVQQDMPPTCSMHFGARVIQAHRSTDNVWEITTSTGQVLKTSLVVAADGAKSTWRQDHLKIEMSGQPTMQHLINVHFSLKDTQDKVELPPAMLYTVFSSQVLAMIVRHGPTDYVMQIPYFPPYQTIHDDFTQDKVQHMVEAALGAKLDFEIRSIRSWTMGSLVAKSYAQSNVFLVGDAAHVFPPAGGFGMNTGLQDVLALAWRLQLLNSVQAQAQSQVSDPGQVYTRERQSVAHQNAALSVRNYQRVLGVMKSCYLDERNLPILLKSLEASAQLGLPLSWQKATFQNLFRTALLPLRMLQGSPTGPYSRHVTNNLRRLLESGQGLPLLFPNHEVAFSYPVPQELLLKEDDTKSIDWSKDSTAGMPQILSGQLFPHVPCQVVVSDPTQKLTVNQKFEPWTTTRDLPTKLSTLERPCPFALVSISEVNRGLPETSVSSLATEVEKELGGVPVEPAQLWIGSDQNLLDRSSRRDKSLLLWISQWEWERRRLLSNTFCLDHSMLVLIRPDGHVACVTKDDQNPNMLHEIVASARYTLGIDMD